MLLHLIKNGRYFRLVNRIIDCSLSKFKSEFKDIILKPREGNGSKGILINPSDISKFKDEEYMVQELLHGKEITTSAYVDSNSNLIGSISLERELKAGTTVSAKNMIKTLIKLTLLLR